MIDNDVDIALKCLKESDVSNYKIAMATGLSQSAIGKWKNGTILPSVVNARILIDYFNNNNSEILKTDSSPVINFEGKGVPYYDVDFIAGFDVVINDQTTTPAYYINYKPYNKATCWVNVTGHSMEPSISAGDTIALQQISNWEDFLLLGEIYAIVTENFRTIKIVAKGMDNESYLLIPLNKAPEYSEQEIPKRLIQSVFKVLGAVKKF